MTRLSHVVAEALRHVRAEPWLALVTVIATAHALFFVGAAAWTATQARTARDALADGLVVSAGLDPGLDEAQVKAVLDKLAAPTDIEVVRVRTPREERERLGQMLGPGLLDGIDDLALPLGVTVDLRLAPESLDEGSLARLDALLGSLREVQGVVTLPWNPTHARTLFALADLVRWLGVVLGLGALVVAVTIGSQLVRRRLARGHDHRALALAFGATPRWIELPHYAVAALLGALGAALALAVALVVQHALQDVVGLVPGLAGAAPIFGGLYLVWCLAAGIGLGLFGAWLSLRAAAREG